MMPIHVPSEKVKYSHVHKIKQTSSLIVGRYVAYLWQKSKYLLETELSNGILGLVGGVLIKSGTIASRAEHSSSESNK